MNTVQLTPDIAVSGQIEPEHMPQLAALGFRSVIDNRPDHEIPAELSSEVMAKAAQEAGLRFHYIPIVGGQIDPDQIVEMEDALMRPGPTLAYCRSGTRSTTMWALTRAPKEPLDQIIAQAAEAGYDLAPMRPLLEAVGRTRG